MRSENYFIVQSTSSEKYIDAGNEDFNFFEDFEELFSVPYLQECNKRAIENLLNSSFSKALHLNNIARKMGFNVDAETFNLINTLPEDFEELKMPPKPYTLKGGQVYKSDETTLTNRSQFKPKRKKKPRRKKKK